MKRFMLLIGVVLFGLALQAQSVTYTCRYWFDQNHGQAVTTTFNDTLWQAELDVGSLSEGLHTLNIHVMDTSMKWSAPQDYLFFKVDETMPENHSYHCWFDQDFDNEQSGLIGNGSFLLNVENLEEGLHTLNVVIEGHALTSTKSYLFFKVPEEDPAIEQQYICWFDDDYDAMQTGALGSGSFLLNVENLEEGLHTLNVVIKGHALTSTKSYLFFKVPEEDPAIEQQYICWFDDDYDAMQTGALGSGSFLLDVDGLSSGLHVVNVQLKKGTTLTSSKCYFFFKTEGIEKWEYCINGNWENKITTDVDITDTLDVVGLLPVETQPIRSTCFQFHPNGDTPEIFAKNEITFRFWDSGKRFKDQSKFYVDENVVEVVQADTLERNSTETMPAPRNNQITWFKLDTGVGDSLVLKADKACTMQLFAPSGEEVYSATASEAIVFGGCHAWEDGTYYLAVHDVTGSAEIVSVTYQHFDKYVVLAYSPEKVGNRTGNRFLIDLIGNGFNYLENAMFIRENDTILLNQVIISSRTKPRLQFLISDNIANGKYDFHLMFRDGEEMETLFYVEALDLEEPNPGEKLITITTPARTANPFPVRITVENTGNMDYVYVPFNIAFTWPTNSYEPDEARIDRIDFADFCATMTYEADSLGYNFAVMTDNLLGMQKKGGIMFLGIPYLKAHETKTYTLNFTAPAHIRFDLYAWTGEGYEYNVDFDTLLVSNGNREMPEPQNLIDFVETALELDGRLPRPDEADGFVFNNPRSNPNKNYSGLDGLLQNIYDNDGNGTAMDEIHHGKKKTSTPGSTKADWSDEKKDNTMNKQNNAAQNPNPDPGFPCSVFLCHPGDPNDIHGYLSESGSHYMRQEIQNVQYEIEFENDTTLATAAAHTIIVRDTLDATKFDLNSLAARSVTIGDKRLELNGERTFARTLDLRPEIYVIAQVEQEYDASTGIIQWTIESLDPMTMEPTTNPYQGVLPVNYSGNGVGFIDYSVNLKEAFADGTEISNRAGIIFDQEDQILTPVWTNIVDAVKPTSQIETVEEVNDSLSFNFVSSDNRSGVWYHVLYHRNDSTEMQWQVKKPQIIGNEFMLQPELLTTEYLVIAVDSAGNREEKEMVAEYIYYYGDLSATTQANTLAQGWNWWSTYVEQDGIDGMAMLQNSLGHNGLTIKSQNDFTDNFYQDVGEDYWYGSLENITNEQGYLINVMANGNASLTGVAANPASHPISIQPNWNWIGYPVATPQAVTTALAGFNPMADDVVKGQSDFTSYYEGFGWYPDDFMLVPGQSYLYFSNANISKTLTYSGGDRGGVLKIGKAEKPFWKNDVHAFADNINVMAVVSIDNEEQRDENLELGAFVNGECRGSARLHRFAPQDRYMAMLTVSGKEGELVEFRLVHTKSLEMNEVCANHLVFSKNAIVGSLGKPYEIHFGDDIEVTGSMTLYPNPVESGKTFSLNVPQGETIVEVVISDVLGNQLRHETGVLDPKVVKGLPTAGVYVIKVVAKSGNTYYERLIVE